MNGAEPASGLAPGEAADAAHRRVALVLRIGLVTSLVLLAGPLVVLVAHAPASASGDWVGSNPLVRFLGLGALAAGLVAGDPKAYLALGVYALVATPVIRVATGIGTFAAHGERRMATLTVVVLALLLLGLLVIGPLVR